MNQDESIESQVALLMAESKLRKVIYNYCSMQDKRELNTFMDLFTDDCRFSYPGGGLHLRGKDSVRDYFVNEVFAHHEYCFHACHNVNIDVDQDQARAEAYFGVHSQYKGDPQEGYGRYLFAFRKEGREWRISELVCPLTLWNGTLAPTTLGAYERFKL